MADGKNSFILYTDIIHTIQKLSNEKAGELFKHVLMYVNDQNPTTTDPLIEIAFEPIKQALKRDLKKYESLVERNKLNGSKGGRGKKRVQPKKPIGFSGNPTKPKKADSDIGIDIERRKKEFKRELAAFKERYTLDILKAFYEYWTERSPKGRKMRFEKEPVFEMAKRLVTWMSREKPQKPKFTPTRPKASLDDETSN